MFDKQVKKYRLEKNIRVETLHKIKIEMIAFVVTWISLIVVSSIINEFYPVERWPGWLLNTFFISFPILLLIFRRDLHRRFPFKEEKQE